MPREEPYLLETKLTDCTNKIKKKNTTKTETIMKWADVRRGQQLKYVSLLDVELIDV